MKTIFNPRLGLLLAGIILLAGGIIFEEKHHAATLHKQNLITPELTYTLPQHGREFEPPSSGLDTNLSLWFNPAQEIHDDGLTYARVLFQSELGDAAAAYDRMEKPVTAGKINLPSMNLADKTVNYSIFSIGNFSASLSLTPVLPSPQAIIPNEIKPGLGGSFSF